MTKIKKAQKGGCLSTTGSGTRTSIYKQAAGEGRSSGDGKAARQFARDDRKIDKAKAKMDREEAKAAAKAPKAMSGMKVKKAQSGTKVAKYVSPYKSEKTADSTQYFKDKKDDINRASSEISKNFRPVTKGYMLDTARRNNIEREYDKERQKVMSDLNRQGAKGKPGFDKYGNPVSYKQASGSKKKAGGMVGKSKPVVKIIKKSIKKK